MTHNRAAMDYYHEVRDGDEAEGFSRRVIARVRCPKCGAEIRQWCRTVEGYEKRGIVMLCRPRRDAYLALLTGAEDVSSDVRISPVVGSIVYIVPVNKQAAWVVSRGAQWQQRGSGWRGMGPLRTRPVPRDMPSMIGTQRGKLTCVGLSETHAGKGHQGGAAAWICRCTCGYYVLRTTKALRRSEVFDCCDVCNRDIQIARRAEALA